MRGQDDEPQSRFGPPRLEGAPGNVVTEGEGEGKTLFCVTDGRASKSQSSLRVKVSATIPNPGGGDDMDLKAQLKIETSHTLGK